MRKTKYSKEYLEQVVKDSVSMAEILRKLNLRLSGGNHRNIAEKLLRYSIDTSHLKGQRWSKGLTGLTCSRIITRKKPEDVLTINSVSTRLTVKNKLIEIGVAYSCAICGVQEWNGKSLTLHVHHKNGNPIDNRQENVQFLCPNCHQQTETWGSKNAAVLQSAERYT